MSAQPTLLVMLPGAYDSPADFTTHGFDTLACAAGFDWQGHPTDLTAVADGRLVHDLYAQVLHPAREQGRRIVLGGISIGGLMALACQDCYPDSADALVLLAPYPGNRSITRQIASQGGVRQWAPGELPEGEGELRGWRALKRLGARRPPALWLGYGRQDRFATGHALMAEALPPAQVSTVDGGHDWPTWRTLWAELMTRGLA